MTAGPARRNTRVSFHVTASLRTPGGDFVRCETRDLSMRGIFVIGVKGPRVGDRCRTELCLSGTSRRTCLFMEGTVVRTEEDGLALHFTGMDIESFTHLRNIVYYNAGDPDSIEGLTPSETGGG